MIKVKKYFFIILLFFLSCAKNELDRPNILFIMSDDHTSQAWGIYGGILEDYVKNDGIKRLEKSGIVLENMFCTNSICVPSRASILTGKYSHINGVYNLPDALDPDSLTVSKILQNNGYQTSLIGKWHLKKEPSGFDFYKVLPGQGLYNNPYFKTKENWEDGYKGGVQENGFSADIIGDSSIKWLSKINRDRPFFMMTHFKATHEPFDYPERHNLLNENIESIIKSNVASVSVGKYQSNIILDLDYEEDSNAEADVNFVMNEQHELVEVQVTAEKNFFSKEEFNQMLNLAEEGVATLIEEQNKLF